VTAYRLSGAALAQPLSVSAGSSGELKIPASTKVRSTTTASAIEPSLRMS